MLQLCRAVPLGSSVAQPTAVQARSRRRATSLLVTASKKESGGSGIHDPIGWGQRGKSVKPQQAGQEEAARLQGAHLAAEQERSDAKLQSGGHQPSGSAASRLGKDAPAQKEILEVEEEKRADEEYSHMSRIAKWYMEAKGLLYAWLKTGVEPL